MNPHITKALASLQNAHYAGYFDEMDKIVPVELRTPYSQHKGMFIADSYPFNFYQQLEVFAKDVDKALSVVPPVAEAYDKGKAEQTNNNVLQNTNAQAIEDFRSLLFQKLEKGFEATPDVFQLIEKCAFHYNKGTFADLKTQVTQPFTALAPAGFIVALKSFILTIY